MREMKMNTNDEFIFFINWLVDKKDYSGSDICWVVAKYWKCEDLWKEYNEYADKKANELYKELKKQ